MSDAKSNVRMPQPMIDIWNTPCPVCGALPVLMREQDDRTGEPTGYRVACHNCGVEPTTIVCDSIDDAASDWMSKVERFGLFCAQVDYDPAQLLTDDGQAFAAAIFAALPDILDK